MTYVDSKQTTQCYTCGKDIAFSDEHISKKGKMIPQDVAIDGELLGNHDCPAREQDRYINKQNNAKEYKCFRCGDTIIFDDKYKSKNNGPVPLDPNIAAPHVCIQR